MTFPLRLAGGLVNAGALRRRHPSWWAVREVAGMRRAALLCVAMVLSATVSAGVAQAAECHMNVAVYDSGDSGLRGQLRSAIVEVCDGGTIFLRPGIVIGLEQGELVIPSGKTLTLMNPSRSQSSDVAIDAQSASRVMRVEQGAVLTLERLTIQHGLVVTDVGGGILNQGTLNLVDSAISGSGAFIGGGGISNDGTVKLYANSSITGNSATRGGGISNAGSVTLNDNSSITGNSARGGGGIFNTSSGSVTLNHNSSITGNGAGSGDGGIFNMGSVTLNDDSSITGNSGGLGVGGISNSSGGSVTLNDSSSIADNAGGFLGGGIVNGGSVTLNDNSSITGNSADLGGGIYNSGSVTLNDVSTITGNTATGGQGGGVYLEPGSTLVINDSSSITGNIPDNCFPPIC
jgi:hypothetical protein